MGNGCWAIFWDGDHYRGERLKLDGPNEWENLEDTDGVNWNNRIMSIEVGPDAIVEAYHDKNFGGEMVVYGPLSRIHDVGGDLRDEFGSIIIKSFKEEQKTE